MVSRTGYNAMSGGAAKTAPHEVQAPVTRRAASRLHAAGTTSLPASRSREAVASN